MKSLKKQIAVLVVGLALASCTTVAPLAATNNPIGDKVGKSETSVLFGAIVLNKNYGVQEAAKKGKLETIATVDVETKNFIFFMKKTMVVTGQ